MSSKELVLTASKNPVTPEPGVYENVPFEEYLSWNCFSKSSVGAALKSGAHLDHFIHGKKKSRAMTLGSLVDCLVLEPQFYDERYVIQPATYQTEKTTGRAPNKKTEIIEKPWNLNSKTCKEIRAEIEATGKEIISQDMLTQATEINKALMSKPEAAVAITAGKKQVSFVWRDEETGVLCKGRADLVGAETIDDLKTTLDGSPEAFSRTIGQFHYHVQAFAYTDAWRVLTGESKEFRFIVAETSQQTEIPEVALYNLESSSVIVGGLVFRRALMNVSRWLEYGIKGYSDFYEPIGAPSWLVNRELNESDQEVEL